MNNEKKEIKFDKFEKLDRKVEQKINEVENMSNKQLVNKALHTSFAGAAIWAFVLSIFMETLGRFSTTSILGGIQFIFDNPLVFIYNTLIIFATLVIASLFKRRLFVFTIVSIFWMAIGIANGVILTQRMTPFTVKDLSVLDDGLTIVTNYMKTWQIVVIAAGIIIAIGLLVLLFIQQG